MEQQTTETQAEPVKRGRGRPRKHADAAARQAAYRERHGFVPVTVEMPEAVYAELCNFMARHSMNSTGPALTQSQMIVKLVATQLLRKR